MRDEEYVGPVQIFETSVCDIDGNWSATFLVIPRRSLQTHQLSLDDATEVCEVLELSTMDVNQLPAPLASTVPTGLAAVLVAQKHNVDIPEIMHAVWHQRDSVSDEVREDYYSAFDFASLVAYTNLIPFEQSPLEATSLASILVKGGTLSASGVGAFVGWVVAAHTTPLLLVTVPAGMIICGAASGVAAGLQQGLRDTVLRWLTDKGKAAKSKRKETVPPVMPHNLRTKNTV
jgi:hypothetical protein